MPGQALEDSAVQVYNAVRTHVLGLEPSAPEADAGGAEYAPGGMETGTGESVFARPAYQGYPDPAHGPGSGSGAGGEAVAGVHEGPLHSDDEADAIFGAQRAAHASQPAAASPGYSYSPPEASPGHGGPGRYYSQSTPGAGDGGGYLRLALDGRAAAYGAPTGPGGLAGTGYGVAADMEGEEAPEEEEEEEEDEEVLVSVKARLLVACDGPFSEIRQRVLGDGPPTFDVSGVTRGHGSVACMLPGR